MKKFIALIASILLATLFMTGCMGSAATNSVWKTTDDNKGVEEKATKEMCTLVDGMMKKGDIEKDATVTEMSPTEQKIVNGEKKGEKGEYGGYLIIGAEEGYRFSYAAGEKKDNNINLELYRFGKANDTSKKVIADIKSKGSFTIEGEKTPIDAVVSKDEKFLMIFQDSNSDKELIEKATKDFNNLTSADKKEKDKDNKKEETKAKEKTEKK